MANRTCNQPGCSNAHRARGYCSTHYNKHVVGEVRRHPKVIRSCVICGAQVMRRADKDYAPTCSVRCRAVVQWGPRLAPTNAYDWAADAVKRAREYGAAVVDQFDRESIFDRDDWTCWVCGVRCSSPSPYVLTAATIDHVLPLSAGGHHTPNNVRTCCLSCNSRRGALTPQLAAG